MRRFVGADRRGIGLAGRAPAPQGQRIASTTLTLLKAIAAPAITGLSRPSAASGMPTTL